MSHPTIIGNVVDLQAGEILLPLFVQRKEDGLYVNLAALESGRPFAQFAERVFGSGARFEDLDYEIFLNLVYLWEPAELDAALADFKRKGRPPLVRIARDIVAFPPERRDIYRGVKIGADGGSAEYMFEPVVVERIEDDPSAPDGKRRSTERLSPDFDEFIAALWDKGVRFGIDVRAVREAIARDQAARLTIATAKAPIPGRDASIDEQTDLLRRDDAPRLLPNGRMDLRHYRNRFPQVVAGTRLFKKVPRVAGRPGWTVAGEELTPPIVQDFDIETLAGPGTKLTRDGSGEYLVAAKNGFLDIDARSGQVSIIDKIVSREGVSMRTTGDLSLAGDDYEEHGEVQEKRVVEGHNMSFFADVFGNILSDGGRVTLQQNISGGSVHSPNGTISVAGTASRALIEARGGEVTVERAEGAMIIGGRVRVGRAVNSDIVADEVIIEEAEGCTIAARNAVVNRASSRREVPTRVILMLPDLLPFEDQRKALEGTRSEAEAKLTQFGAAVQSLGAQPDMKTYAAMAPRIKAKSVVLNPTQQTQWESLLGRVAPNLRKLAALNEEVKALHEHIEGIAQELAAVAQARKDAANGIGCRIEAVAGDAQVYARRPVYGESPLASLTPTPLHRRLHELTGNAERIFAGQQGSFEWQAPAAE
ncbi:MAG: flagellar assembly protein A [Ignavibacteria bacterium]